MASSYIKGCDFSGANLTGTSFKSSSFRKNTIANTVWKHTSFTGSDIADIVFTGNIEDCYFDNCSFSKVTFQDATLTNTFFKSRSLKRLRFIDCQADKMTYEFLKNGKADVSGIALITS